MKKYDLVVIGAGPAGTPAAMAAAKFGKRVLLVDKRDAPGGECLFEGCIPSKVLENAAQRYAMLKEAQNFHVTLKSTPQIHWEEVLRDKEAIIARRSQAALGAIGQLPTLEFMQAKAAFKDSHTLILESAQGQEEVRFDKALIATGGKVHLPPFAGSGVDKAWTNRDIFFEEEIPSELLFVGAGAISCELAQMFNKLGTKCHILERGERILKHVDEEAALAIQERMRRSGITIDLNLSIERIDHEAGRFMVQITQDGARRSIDSAHLLLATGRIANLDGLGLEDAGVAYDHHGVTVDEMLQSSQPHIYACGDCIDAPRFAHTASYEAGIVVHNMFAPHPHRVDYDKNSWVLFTDPQVAQAGLGEAEAKARGIDVMVESYDYSVDARAQIDKQETGFVKFVIDRRSGVILGVTILSEDAASLAGEAALIVSAQMTAMQVQGAIHPHPTLCESFGKLAQKIFFGMMMAKGGGHGKK